MKTKKGSQLYKFSISTSIYTKDLNATCQNKNCSTSFL